MKKSSQERTKNNGFLPNSVRFISSCVKAVSSNVRSAGVSVAASISPHSDDQLKDQVLWASFDKLELAPSSIKHVLLLGYSNGFQVLDVEDASNFSELVSKRDDPVTFLQMQPFPVQSDGTKGFKESHPLLLVVASDDTKNSGSMQTGREATTRDGYGDPQMGNHLYTPTAVRFYSLRSHNYVHVLRFRSAVYMVRCSPRIVAVGLATQIHCFDSLSLESKFSVLTHPVPQLGGPGTVGVNIGYGPMAVGPRWLAYASSNPLPSNTGRVSPQCLTPSPGVSPSTSPGNGSLVARYAMESSKQLAVGLMNLGDKGYKSISRYYNDLRPDGSSSPVSSNSSWKGGRVSSQSAEIESAGTVIIRDFVSKAVVSQFKAHTSPISAICFDPSGTLLVTASVCGNNINVFRIMPSQSGSGSQGYDWASSHVHLYKLHRGMTPAVIQDICFSHYSQWISIVSSRGTCHVFVLSPFGGETGLHLRNSHVDGPSLLPVLSQPWWSSSPLMISQQSFSSPPPPITLSVVSRVRVGNSGWINTVSSAASTAAGKVSLPSGVSAIFHSSAHPKTTPPASTINPLEYLLVYAPSGNVIQYELLPSLGGEQGESALRMGTGSLVHMPEEELRVKPEPVQWWDVCRRVDWLEREECIYQIPSGGQKSLSTCDRFCDLDSDIGEKDSVKPHDHSHWYLSNAEVQSSSGRIPIWQKSKISFFRMNLLGDEGTNPSEDHIGGEMPIENLPVQEIEIKRKDLLPVFDHFHRIQPDWSEDRGAIGKRYSGSSISSYSGKEKFTGDAAYVQIGSPRTPTAIHDPHQMSGLRPYNHLASVSVENDVSKEQEGFLSSSSLKQRSFQQPGVLASNKQYAVGISSIDESYAIHSPPSLKPGALSTGGTIAGEVKSSSSVVTSEVSNTSSNRSDLSMNILDEGPQHEDMHDPLDFGEFFEEGYCKASRHDHNAELTDVITDSSNSLCNIEKQDEDEDDDDMLGGVFAFSEEG